MIVHLCNLWGAWKFKREFGVNCEHPCVISRLIDLGRDKMFWCTECGWTEFSCTRRRRRQLP